MLFNFKKKNKKYFKLKNKTKLQAIYNIFNAYFRGNKKNNLNYIIIKESKQLLNLIFILLL
jgi:hypothetical protein